MKKITLIQKSIILLIASAIIGFCIITNTQGVYRSYWPEDLPFVIQMNVDTPESYDEHIQYALDTWNAVEGSYFEFVMGPRSTANGAFADGINLLYFDNNYDNFTPGSNTIAFSSTRTSTVGGYHAIESDYIYNAAGFPPATDGSPNNMDLVTITLHEIGHHMGLSHHGPAGNSNGAGSEGCGINLPSQVMFWSVARGSLKRELFLHDEMGAVAIYPNFIIAGSITDTETGDPIENAKLVFNEGTYAAYVGPVESSLSSNRGLRPGEVYTEAPTLDDGSYLFAMNTANFSFQVEKFGYENSQVVNVNFDTPVGYGNTQDLTTDFELTKTPRVNLSGTVLNTKTGEPVQPEIVVTWVGDDNETQSQNAEADGSFSFVVPHNAYYNIEFFFDPPFEPYYIIDSLLVGSTNTTVDLSVMPANLLFVYGEENEIAAVTYKKSFENLGFGFVEWNTTEKEEDLNPEFLDEFAEPLTIFWLAGGDDSSNLTNDDIALLEEHLSKGDRLIMAGKNIVEFEDSNGALIPEYAGVRHAGNSSGVRIIGYAGDIIGDGINSLMLGAGKDLLSISDTRRGAVERVLFYGSNAADSANLGAVRSQNEDEGWKFILFSDAIEKASAAVFDTLISRSVKYANSDDFVTSVEIDLRNEDLPNVYSISQNYPNPFNPSTTIKFNLPVNANVSLKIFNILGEQVDVLKEGFMNAGTYELRWNAVNNSISSGIYFYRIEASGVNGSNYSQTMKMILLK